MDTSEEPALIALPSLSPVDPLSVFVSDRAGEHPKMHRMWDIEDIVRIINGYGTRSSAAALSQTCRAGEHPKMHRMWDIEDIVRIINGYGTRSSAAALSQTCRSLFHWSIPYVWAEIPDLNALDDLLTTESPRIDPEIRTLGRSSLPLSSPIVLYVSDRSHGPEEIARNSRVVKRFLFYASYVQTLTINDAALAAAIRISSVIRSHTLPTTFSHLRSVHFTLTSAGPALVYTPFLGPAVSQVSLSITPCRESLFFSRFSYNRMLKLLALMNQWPRLDCLSLKGIGKDIAQLLYPDVNYAPDFPPVPYTNSLPGASTHSHIPAPLPLLRSLCLELVEGYLILGDTPPLLLPQLDELVLRVQLFSHATLLMSKLAAPALTGIHVSSSNVYEALSTFTPSLREAAELISSSWPDIRRITIQVATGGMHNNERSLKASAFEPLFRCHSLEGFSFQSKYLRIDFGDDDIWTLAQAWPNLATFVLSSPEPQSPTSRGRDYNGQLQWASLRSLEYLATFCLKLDKLVFDPVLEYTDQQVQPSECLCCHPPRNRSCKRAADFRLPVPSMSRLRYVDVGHAPQCKWEDATDSLRCIFPRLTTFEYSEDGNSRRGGMCIWASERDNCMTAIQAALMSGSGQAAVLSRFPISIGLPSLSELFGLFGPHATRPNADDDSNSGSSTASDWPSYQDIGFY